MQPASEVRYTSTVTMPPDGTLSNTATMGSVRPGSIIPHCLCATFEAARAVCNRVKLMALAESLGGVETLISHPATMTHASVPAERRREIGLTDSLVRISAGIEDPADLIADLEQALA